MPRVSILSARCSVGLRQLAVAFFAACVCLAAGGFPACAQFGQRDRILQPIDSRSFSVTTGNLHPAAKPQWDMGELAPATRLGRVTIFFNRTPQQESDLQTLLSELQDRSSPNYHRWLSPEDFAARFGVSQGDVDKVVAWLQAQGLTIEQVSRSRTWVAFSGAAQQVGAALQTSLHRYNVGGETHFMMSREPSVPAAMAGMVLGFRGLDDFRLKPHAVKKVEPRLTSGITGNHFLAPGDLATIYNLGPLYTAGTTGAGQKLAVAGQTAINVTDVHTFRSLSGLPVNDPQVILVPQAVTGNADPGMVAGDIDEANLDLDWAGAVARNAAILYVYSKNVTDAFTYIIDQNLAPVLSISYGLCEGGTGGFTQSDANVLASLAQEANTKGITIVAPSGDSGAADCDNNVSTAQQGLAVDLPGALPYATSVGGTMFFADIASPNSYWTGSVGNEVLNSALSYIPETSWNDTDVNGLAATGGGSSIYFPKPSWQTGTGVPTDGARDVPDISFSASGGHDGYLACSEDNPSPGTFQPSCVNGFRKANGNFTVFGGTSAGVPVFAGIIALINQQTGSAGQGNVNPQLYAMATASPSSFHDITSGNNAVPFKPSTLADCTTAGTVGLGYIAGIGYDLVTGLGSINAQNLVNDWTSVAPPAAGASVSPNFQLSISPAAMTVKRGACGTTQVTLAQGNGFVLTPAFTCSFVKAGVLVPENFPPIRSWPLSVVVVAICLWFAAVRQCRPPGRELATSRWSRVLAAGLALAGMLAIGCGGGGSGSSSSSSFSAPSTPPTATCSVSPIATSPLNYTLTVDAPASSGVGSGTVTVTGAIGGVNRSAQLTLTVN